MTTSRRSTRKNGYKRPTPPNTLVRNRSTIGGTKVPGIGAPKIQLAKRSSTAWHTTLAVRAKAIACSIGLQGMRTPTVCLYPWTTAGAHLVNCHQSLQVYLPRRSHLDSHIQIRVRRRESPQSRQRTHKWSLSHWTRQHHGRHVFTSPLTPSSLGSCPNDFPCRTLTTKYYLVMKRISRPDKMDILLE